MAHKTDKELRNELEQASKLVELNGKYTHFKHPTDVYTVTGFIIDTEDIVCVLYTAKFERLKGITFSRPLNSFLDKVTLEDGSIVNRFNKVI